MLLNFGHTNLYTKTLTIILYNTYWNRKEDMTLDICIDARNQTQLRFKNLIDFKLGAATLKITIKIKKKTQIANYVPANHLQMLQNYMVDSFENHKLSTYITDCWHIHAKIQSPK